ncbi:MAG: hypothetical protein SNJ70_05860 [Armatimonadota bacterium]
MNTNVPSQDNINQDQNQNQTPNVDPIPIDDQYGNGIDRTTIFAYLGLALFVIISIIVIISIRNVKFSNDSSYVTTPKAEQSASLKIESAQPAPVPANPRNTAVTPRITLEEMPLKSEITEFKNEQGLTFLRFKYVDKNGDEQIAEMPKPLAEGTYSYNNWLGVFNIYKVKQITTKPKKSDKHNEGIEDFPFIAPKPAEEGEIPSDQ